jgi:hypothetical protein
MAARHDDLTRALEHLRAAQRLLRSALALRPLVAVARVIRLTEALLTLGQPAQPRLELEPPDDFATL